MKTSILTLALTLAATAVSAQSGTISRILHCTPDDANASPYTTVQLRSFGNKKAEIATHTTAFNGSEEFSFPAFEKDLSVANTSQVSILGESKTDAGSVIAEWGGGDAAYLELKRPKKIIRRRGTTTVIKGSVYVGEIGFPNSSGPKHLQDGGVLKVHCTPATTAWVQPTR